MGENDLNTLRVDEHLFENGEKDLRFQKYPDTFGRDLKEMQRDRLKQPTFLCQEMSAVFRQG